MDSCLAIPELLEKIVVFLDTSDLFKATRVCRAWQDAFLKYAFRDFVYLRNTSLQELTEHGRHVLRLKAFSVLDEDLEVIGLYCPNIKSLEICTEQVSMDAFDRFCQRMTGLESLHLHLGQTFPAQLILASFATHSWPHLTTLSLTGNPPFAPHTLSTNIHHNILYHALVACSSTLVHLRLENMMITPNLHYVSVESMPQENQQKWSISSLLSNFTKPAPAVPIHPVDSSAYSIHLREVQKKEPWRRFISVNTDENIPELVRVRSMLGSPFQSTNEGGNVVANDHDNKKQGKSAIEWRCLRTFHIIKFYDERSYRRLFMDTILQRCQNLQELRLEKSNVAIDTRLHLKKLQTLYVEAASTYTSLVLERGVVNILALPVPELGSLTLITVFHSLANNNIPHGRLDQLEELTRKLALGAETRDVDRILSHHYPRLRKLKLIGMKWGESPAMNPSRWLCRSTLQEFEGGLIVPFWGRSEGETPVASVQDVYRHLPALWRVRYTQQRFRLLCGWLSGMTSLEKLYNDAKAGEETSSNNGGDEIVDDEESQHAVIESSTITRSEDNAEFDTQGSSIIQIRVIEVERLEEEDELPLLKKELQVVLRAFPNLQALRYVGRKNPFTAEAWEWARRARPNLRMEHLITSRR